MKCIHRFGNGYMINVRCDLESSGEVMQSVESLIPEARLRERRPRQLIWHVQPNTLQISTLFKRMEEARTATPMVIQIELSFQSVNVHLFWCIKNKGRLLDHANYAR